MLYSIEHLLLQKGGVHILEFFLDFWIGKHLLHHPVRGKDLPMLLHPFLGFDQGNVLGLIRLRYCYGFILFQRQSPRPPLLCSVFYYNKFLSVLLLLFLYPTPCPKRRTKKASDPKSGTASFVKKSDRPCRAFQMSDISLLAIKQIGPTSMPNKADV